MDGMVFKMFSAYIRTKGKKISLKKFKSAKKCLEFLKNGSSRYKQFLQKQENKSEIKEKSLVKVFKHSKKELKILNANFGTKFFLKNIPYLLREKPKVRFFEIIKKYV